ncbi:hypothetical protein [Bradyrhizobium genosp. P]|uniref:hypothetical protein n=1 Tax=Bradyrhizobium genosp. P TaxID=83641 RepID=UPI003CE9338E
MRKILAACSMLALGQAQANAQQPSSGALSGAASAHLLAAVKKDAAPNEAADRSPSATSARRPFGTPEEASPLPTDIAESGSIDPTVTFLADVYGPAPQTTQRRAFRYEQAKRYIDAHPGTPGVLFIEDVIDHRGSNDLAPHRQLEYRETPAHYYVGGGTLNDTVFGFVDGPYPPVWTIEASPVYSSLIYVDAQGNETYVSESKVQQMNNLAPELLEEMMQRQDGDRRINSRQGLLTDEIKRAADNGDSSRVTQLTEQQRQEQAAHCAGMRVRQQRDAEIDRMYDLNLKADVGTISAPELEELDNYSKRSGLVESTASISDRDAAGPPPISCPLCRSTNIAVLLSRHFTGSFRFTSSDDRSVVIVYRHGYAGPVAVLTGLQKDLSGPIFGSWTNVGMTLPPPQK